MNEKGKGVLQPEDIARIKRDLSKIDSPMHSLPPPLPPREIETGDPVRGRFALGILSVATFLLVLCAFLPADDRRSLFVGASALLLVVGAWQLDLAKRQPKSRTDSS
jgi:hypothetical protein